MQLIQILKNGYQYSVNEGDEVRQVLVPPNKYMLAAAEGLVKLIEDNQKLVNTNQQLHNNLIEAHDGYESYKQTITNLRKELEDAKTKIQSLERVAADGNTSRDPNGIADHQ